MQRITLFCLTLAWALSVSPMIESPAMGEETKTLWVAHHRVDCIGVAPQKCYLIKDIQYEDWRFWYGEIEGFDFEDGYAYELRVIEREIDNPAADAPSRQLELVEVIHKVEAFDPSAPKASSRPATPTEPRPLEEPPIETVEAETPTPPIDPLLPELVESAIPAPAPAPPRPEPIEPTETAPGSPDPVESTVPAPTPPEPVESAVPAPVLPEPVPAPVSAPSHEEPAPPVTDAAPSSAPAAPPSPPAPAKPAPALGQVLRGHLTLGAGVEARSFKLCGAEESIWVEDRTDSDLWSLYRRLASYPNRPVYMEVTGELSEAPSGGFGAHFQQQILIRDVRNASVESAGCFAEPTRFAFRASGNEPFWNVEISRRGLAFSEMGPDARILFPHSPPTFFGEQIIYRSQIRSLEPRAIVVRLVEESCADSMADATFSFTASVTIDDRTLTGCAREGEEEP